LRDLRTAEIQRASVGSREHEWGLPRPVR